MTIVTDRDTGKSCAFGFVEVATAEAANDAVTKLNGGEAEAQGGGAEKAPPSARPRPGHGVTTPRRVRPMPRLRPGDVVIRRHRLLKTHGTVVRYDGEDANGASRGWIRWDHPTTLPNPSLETLDDVELVEGDSRVTRSDRELTIRTPGSLRPYARSRG